MLVLGISQGFHDAAVSVISDNNILFAAHAERYSKVKNDSLLNNSIVAEALSYGKPDVIAYYEKPFLKKIRQLYCGQYSDLRLSVKKTINQFSGLSGVPIQYFNHHMSHAAAGFQTSKFHDATVVVIDAIGEWDTVTIWDARYDGHNKAVYKKLWGRKYPHSIGLMYSAFTKQVDLRPMDEEYIMMGMAAYAKPSMSTEISSWLINDKENIRMNHNLHLGLPDSELLDELNEFEIAAEAQYLTEELIFTVMRKAKEFGKSDNLVYMGGVALNCLANRSLWDMFPHVWIMPNPGDAGSSLGAAALAYGKQLTWTGPYLGTNIGGEYPVSALYKELSKHHIVGVANGRGEFGARALGNRSLLADPKERNIKDRVNDIKRRQKFRPFAPVILEEHVGKYFAMPNNTDRSPYMQVVAKCLRPNDYPAIIHADGTSRVQTVPKDCKSGIRQLLEKWYVHTGCPMLLNTSLNIRGEPIVNDRSDADRFERLYGVKVYS